MLIVAGHAFQLDGPIDALFARRFLASNGDELALDLIDHKAADLAAKHVTADELEALGRLRALVELSGRNRTGSRDLAVTGDDLQRIGFSEGPALGRALNVLLDEVVDDPARNERGWLLERAARELA